MDDLWDLKIFRNNLMFISIIIIIFIVFKWNINEINILWIVKLKEINSIKILILFLIIIAYVLLRYLQYLLKYDLDINYKILIFDIINNKYYQKNIINLREMNVTFLNKNNNSRIVEMKKIYEKKVISEIIYDNWITLKFKNTNICNSYCYKAISDNNIFWWIVTNNKWFLSLFIHNKDESNKKDNIHISYKNNKLIFFILKLKFYIKEHYFFDYYLPIFMWIISIILIITKILIFFI